MIMKIKIAIFAAAILAGAVACNKQTIIKSTPVDVNQMNGIAVSGGNGKTRQTSQPPGLYSKVIGIPGCAGTPNNCRVLPEIVVHGRIEQFQQMIQLNGATSAEVGAFFANSANANLLNGVDQAYITKILSGNYNIRLNAETDAFYNFHFGDQDVLTEENSEFAIEYQK
jgi:hypothetical protein